MNTIGIKHLALVISANLKIFTKKEILRLDTKRRLKRALSAIDDAISTLRRVRSKVEDSRSDISRALNELDDAETNIRKAIRELPEDV